jgi:release factor glutamine methyltransferase
VFALDVSQAALAVARRNAHRHQVGHRITFLSSDLLAALPKAVDLIIANLPYVADEEWPALPQGVRGFEPRQALYGGADGLQFIQQLLNQAPSKLRPGGFVLLEIGETQGSRVKAMARDTFPHAKVGLRRDLSGRDRFVTVETALSRIPNSGE